MSIWKKIAMIFVLATMFCCCTACMGGFVSSSDENISDQSGQESVTSSDISDSSETKDDDESYVYPGPY